MTRIKYFGLSRHPNLNEKIIAERKIEIFIQLIFIGFIKKTISMKLWYIVIPSRVFKKLFLDIVWFYLFTDGYPITDF